MPRKSSVLLALLLGFAYGCSPAHVQQMTKGMWQAKVANIPEFETVWAWNDEAANRKPGMSHTFFLREIGELEIEAQQTGVPVQLSGGTLAELIKDPGFQTRLKALENLKLPSNLATPEREGSLKKYVEEWRNLEKMVTGKGKAADIKKSTERLTILAEQIRYIPGQHKPEGEEAKKYSAVQGYEDPYQKKLP